MLGRISSGNYRGVITLQSRKLAENKAFLAFCTESRILRQQGFRSNPEALFSCPETASFQRSPRIQCFSCDTAIISYPSEIKLQQRTFFPVEGQHASSCAVERRRCADPHSRGVILRPQKRKNQAQRFSKDHHGHGEFRWRQSCHRY